MRAGNREMEMHCIGRGRVPGCTPLSHLHSALAYICIQNDSTNECCFSRCSYTARAGNSGQFKLETRLCSAAYMSGAQRVYMRALSSGEGQAGKAKKRTPKTC